MVPQAGVKVTNVVAARRAEGAVCVEMVDTTVAHICFFNSCLMAITGFTISIGHAGSDRSCQPCHESSTGYGPTLGETQQRSTLEARVYIRGLGAQRSRSKSLDSFITVG